MIGIVCIIAWSALWGFLVFGAMKLFDKKRTDNAFFYLRSTKIPGKKYDEEFISMESRMDLGSHLKSHPNQNKFNGNSSLITNDYNDIQMEYKKTETILDN